MLRSASPVVYCPIHGSNCKGALKESEVQQITQRIQVVRIGTFEIGHRKRFGAESDETVWQPGARYSSFPVLTKRNQLRLDNRTGAQHDVLATKGTRRVLSENS